VERSHSLPRLAKESTLLVLVALGALGLAACSRSKRPAETRPATAKIASSAKTEASAVALCSALHELPSRRRAECCGEPPVIVYFDECVRLLSNAVRARSLRIESANVALCGAKVAEKTRGCDWVAPALATSPPECARAVTGLVGEGGRCSSSLECEGALHCRGQGATTPGVCRGPEAAGGGCGTSVDSLATYLGVRALEEQKPQCENFCDLTSHRCAPKPAPGAPCLASVHCASDQACSDGHCAPLESARLARALPGESCTTDLDCGAGGCVEVAGGKKTCAKKCTSDFASFAGRSPLGRLSLGAKASTRSKARTSPKTE
jgi:hypothetical protein